MKEFGGWYFPDGEAHFPAWMAKRNEVVDGRLTYQYHKLSAAMNHVKQFRVAVDVGSHIGTWAYYLVKRFQMLHAFEPVAAFRDCWIENMKDRFDGPENPKWDGHALQLHDCALGAQSGFVEMIIPALDGGFDTGGTHVGKGYFGNPIDITSIPSTVVRLATLDSFIFANVDFLKIDVEGFEHRVIEGAVETLKRCRPCVIVEQKPHKLGPNFGIRGRPAVDALLALRAKLRQEISGDFILSWD